MLAAAPQAQASSLFACVKKSGAARVFSKKPKCKKGETLLSWNSQGPAGKNGIKGINGTNGKDGTNGKEGTAGKEGKEGVAGQPQKAVIFSATLAASFESPPSAALFSLAGASAKLVCFNFIGNFSIIEAAAPTSSRAETGMVATDTTGKTPEIAQEPVQDVGLGPSSVSILKLSSNTKEPFSNIAHVNGSITTPTGIVVWDAFLKTGPNPAGCTIRGTALTVPL
ncbi:MAG TPA: hypothetical protein VGO29_02485 [Solirubrobacteraceae bacterium]|nr:hypothetical protein [Solirubrobacteraceae bacterium]